MNALLRAALVVSSTVAALTLQAACARSVDSVATSDPSFLSPDAAAPAALDVCISTDCPAPWATCAGDHGLCTTDTRRDISNCGACGNACPHQPPAFNATAVCANSKCVIACNALAADCNHDPADGCEVYTGDDPKNCGGCGNVCKDGELCWKGACGCPSGFTQCDDQCKNTQSDMLNCGSCGNKCVPPTSPTDPAWVCGPNAEPANTMFSCESGSCQLSCRALYGDCDANLCADGCEIDLSHDVLNCGGCGIKCEAGQDCIDGTCLCPAGTVRCNGRCVDFDVDPDNCGSCGNGCPGATEDTANGTPTCTGGRCGYLCYAGFANCDTRLDNGCEVEMSKDPQHCGSCGTKCDAARNQPCVEGQCLTKPCGPAAGTF